MRGVRVVISRPYLTSVWTLFWFGGFCFFVVGLTVGVTGPVWIPVSVAVVCLAFSPAALMIGSALVGPRGVRRAVPFAGWHSRAEISAVRGVGPPPDWEVVLDLNDGTEKRVLRLNPQFALADELDAHVDKLAARIEDLLDRQVSLSGPGL